MKSIFCRCSKLSTLVVVLGGLLLGSVAVAQSLGDVARQTRKEKKGTAKVFTNDNLPTTAPITVTGKVAPAASEKDSKAEQTSASKDAESSDDKVASADGKDNPDKKDAKSDADKKSGDEEKSATEQRDKDAAEWRARFADQKKSIALTERELDVLQREYRLRAAAFYADAGNALRNQRDWADADRDYKAQITTKQKQLDDAKQKLEDMKDQAHKAGLPSSVAD
jgi:hypothetical protein